MEITQGQREMQNTIKAAVASAKAATSMDPVKLIAQDGSEIIIDRRAALVSGTIKSMLAGPGVCVCVHSRGDAPANAESADYPWYHPSGSRSPLHAPPPRHLFMNTASLTPIFCVVLLVRARAGQFSEGQTGEIKFPEINAKVLEKTVQYFYYKLKHTGSSGSLPDFKIEPEHALELLMAANFLDC